MNHPFPAQVSVYSAQLKMGEKLAAKVKKEVGDRPLPDVVIAVPDTSRPIALQCAYSLGVVYREGFIKNRYIGRTFIMPGQAERRKGVRMKLNTIKSEFKGKTVLLIDDSIVRGTTSIELVAMAKEAGAKHVYFVSARAPRGEFFARSGPPRVNSRSSLSRESERERGGHDAAAPLLSIVSFLPRRRPRSATRTSTASTSPTPRSSSPTAGRPTRSQTSSRPTGSSSRTSRTSRTASASSTPRSRSSRTPSSPATTSPTPTSPRTRGPPRP